MKTNNKVKTKLILSCLLVLIALSIFAISAFAADKSQTVLDKYFELQKRESFSFTLKNDAKCSLEFCAWENAEQASGGIRVNGEKVQVVFKVVNADSKTVYTKKLQATIENGEFLFDETFSFSLQKGKYKLIVEADRHYYVSVFTCVIKAKYTSTNTSSNTITLAQGKTKQLTVISQYTGKKVPYGEFDDLSSSNNEVATVNSRGVVTAKGLGKATIKIDYYDPNSYDYRGDGTYKVTVLVNSAKATLYIGESKPLTSFIKNIKNYKNASWSSDNKAVVSVTKKGTASVKAAGDAVLTAKIDGQKYTLNVTVPNVKLNKTAVSVYVGKTVKLVLSATADKTTWSSSNTKVATVSSNGTVKGKKAGNATITATYAGKKYTCKVTVKKMAYGSISGTVVLSGMTTTGPDTGAEVYIIDPSDNSVLCTTIVNGTGNYTVPNVPAGKWVVLILSRHGQMMDDTIKVYGIYVYEQYSCQKVVVKENQTTFCDAEFMR